MRLASCQGCSATFEHFGQRGPLPRFCPPCMVRPRASAEHRSAVARRAALKRWESIAPEDRTRSAVSAARARWGEPRPHRPTTTPKPCARCGDLLSRSHPNWRYCGKPECRLARNAERMKNGGWSKSRRRAIRAGLTVEPFTDASIFERDGWTCGICDAPIDRESGFPSPLSATIDHIIPLSRGGSHSPDNVRCAHLRCNVRRGAGAS